jgi:hypothetical protein
VRSGEKGRHRSTINCRGSRVPILPVDGALIHSRLPRCHRCAGIDGRVLGVSFQTTSPENVNRTRDPPLPFSDRDGVQRAGASPRCSSGAWDQFTEEAGCIMACGGRDFSPWGKASSRPLCTVNGTLRGILPPVRTLPQFHRNLCSNCR